MENYYKKFIPFLEGYTVQGLFDGDRTVDKIVTLQTGDQGRVFFFDQEPIITDMDIELWDHVFSEPTILANSELDSDDKQWLADRYPNFIDWYFFSHALISREWFAHYQYMSAGNYGCSKEKKKLIFDIGLLSEMRQYRLYLFLILGNYVKDQSFYSFNADQDWKEILERSDQFNILENFSNRLEKFIPAKSTSYDDFGKKSTDIINQYKQNHISFEHYSKSDFVVVLETAFQSRKKHLTEKIFKPIVAGKPFILAGAPENLKYLRSYGFKTFDNFINENYDNTLNDKKRCINIRNSIEESLIFYEHMYSLDSYHEKIDECYKISQHNREWFWSHEFYKKVFSEAIVNLYYARIKLSIASKSGKDSIDSENESIMLINNMFNCDKDPM